MDEIKINIDKMTWDDIRLMLSLSDNKDASPDRMLEIVELFDRIVEGGAKAVPVAKTTEVIEAIGAAMAEMGNPKN